MSLFRFNFQAKINQLYVLVQYFAKFVLAKGGMREDQSRRQKRKKTPVWNNLFQITTARIIFSTFF